MNYQKRFRMNKFYLDNKTWIVQILSEEENNKHNENQRTAFVFPQAVLMPVRVVTMCV